MLSFPVAYFIYKYVFRNRKFFAFTLLTKYITHSGRVILQFDFFPFLNFLGIYVVFAIGADDVFVAVDKWKNARLQHPMAATEDIAAIALPDSAAAMFLTSVRYSNQYPSIQNPYQHTHT
jgi:Patched family